MEIKQPAKIEGTTINDQIELPVFYYMQYCHPNETAFFDYSKWKYDQQHFI